MSRHSQYGGGHGERDWRGPYAPGYLASQPEARPLRPRPILWVVALAGLLIWSLIAWFAYQAAAGVTGWVAGNAAASFDNAKVIAAASGVGKQATAVAETLGGAKLIGGGAGFLQTIARPLIIAVWAVGAAVLVAGPLVLSRLSGMMLRRRGAWARH